MRALTLPRAGPILALIALLSFGCLTEAVAHPPAVDALALDPFADSLTVEVRFRVDARADSAVVRAVIGSASQQRRVTASATTAAFTFAAPAEGATVTITATVTAYRAGTAPATGTRSRSWTRPVGALGPTTVDSIHVDLSAVPPSSQLPGTAELPRVYVNTEMPTGGRVVQVPAGANLQTALNNASRGDVLELAAGATYTGNFVLPAKPGTGWIVVRSAGVLPPEGTRVTPVTGAAFARLVTPNAESALRAVAGEASYYRLAGVTITSSAPMTYALAALGTTSATTVEALPTHIILDRVLFPDVPALQTQRCIALNSRHSAVIDSWIAGCHSRDFDAQGIVGWNGPGPYKIVNNRIEGTGENVMFGGADPAIPGLVPSDIEMRRNHVVKPLAWGADLAAWSMKNLIETKNVARWLIEDNVFENNWSDSQTGFAVVFKSSNDGGRCTWCGAEDITFRWNRIINSPGGFNFKDLDDYRNGDVASNGDTLGGGIPMRRVTVSQVEMVNVGIPATGAVSGATYRMFQMLGVLEDIHVSNVTALTRASTIISWDGAPGLRLRFTSNIVANTSYGMHGSGLGSGNPAINHYAPGAVITGNVLLGESCGSYPAGNTCPASVPGSTTAGVDVAELERRLAGVVVAP